MKTEREKKASKKCSKSNIILLFSNEPHYLLSTTLCVVDHEYVSPAPTYRPIDRLVGFLQAAACLLCRPNARLSCCAAKNTKRVLIYQSRKSCQPSKCTDTISKLLQLQLLNLEPESQLKSINNNITTHDFDFIFSNNCHCIPTLLEKQQKKLTRAS